MQLKVTNLGILIQFTLWYIGVTSPCGLQTNWMDRIRVDNINIAESERYPPDEYLHPYEPSQRYQTNINDVSFIEPYESPEPVVLETKVSSDQNGQADQNDLNDQNDQSDQTDEILNDD
ncbi:hypothetical protein Tco_0555380 [Tanacetum coccineum]